nr:MAG TPA: hypothetical protein [Caudoviricetes sp.]
MQNLHILKNSVEIIEVGIVNFAICRSCFHFGND